MPQKRPFSFPPTLTPANWLSPRIHVSAGRTLYLGTRTIVTGMLVRTSCNTIAYTCTLNDTSTRSVVDLIVCLFYVFNVRPLAYTYAIRYIRVAYAICTSNAYPMQSIDRVYLLLYRLRAISPYSMHINAYTTPFYAST